MNFELRASRTAPFNARKFAASAVRREVRTQNAFREQPGPLQGSKLGAGDSQLGSWSRQLRARDGQLGAQVGSTWRPEGIPGAFWNVPRRAATTSGRLRLIFHLFFINFRFA